MKKRFFAALVIAFCFMGNGSIFAMEKTDTGLFYMGRDAKLDNPIYTENNDYYIPLRECAEQIGATVVYIPNSMITVSFPNGIKIDYFLKKEEILFNDFTTIKTNKALQNINGVSYVKINYLYDFLNHFIIKTEENGKKVIRITNTPSISENSEKKQLDFSNSLFLLNSIEKNQNGVVSPISLKIALAMAANGTTGQTQQEILNVLGYASMEKMNEFFSNEVLTWKVHNRKGHYQDDKGTLYLANSLWSKEGSNFSENFKNKIKTYLHSSINTFSPEDDVVQIINTWAKETTMGMIPELIEDTTFDVALINTIYFKCSWLSEFSEENTRRASFYNIDNTESKLDFMNTTEYADYCEANGWQMLCFPYSDSEYNMYFFLPEKGNQQPLDNKTIHKLLQFQENRNVKITIPKFEIENNYDLTETLKAMGIQAMFQNDTDFTAMYANGTGKPITNVIQKTKIIVNEHGTEATSGTVMMYQGTDMTIPPVFRADRPFIYMITRNTANEQKEVLFIGQYVTGK